MTATTPTSSNKPLSTASKKKPKSPPTPSRSLKDAVDDVKRLYSQFSHTTFSRSEIASTLGLSASSGPFAARIFTLKAYGLLEPVGSDFKVSDRFLTLHSNSPDSPLFKQHAIEAIRGADIFREILDDFKTKLPAQAAVAQRLELQKKFNADRAKDAASTLEDSLRFAGVLDSSNNILPVRGVTQEPAKGQAEPQPDVDVKGLQRAQDLRIEIPLGDARKATLVYPPDITKEEAEKIGRVLQAVAA
jgi:hypothetical protein